MAQDLGFDRATSGPTVTLLSANLADGSTSAVTSAVDFSSPNPIRISYEIKLDCQASSSDYATLLIAWSHDNSDFSDSANATIAAIIKCTASTVAIKSDEFETHGRYAKFYLKNDSGGAINSASTALLFWDTFGDIA